MRFDSRRLNWYVCRGSGLSLPLFMSSAGTTSVAGGSAGVAARREGTFCALAVGEPEDVVVLVLMLPLEEAAVVCDI